MVDVGSRETGSSRLHFGLPLSEASALAVRCPGMETR